jgi:transcriptional regulator with XRE-family HTH domain
VKSDERRLAVNLRKQGYSYRQILGKVGVAKSTLSLWLRDVGLAKQQKQKLTERRISAALRGAHSRRVRKEEMTFQIKSLAKSEVGRLSTRERWLIGTALYWAEGSKEKIYKPGVGLIFNNSEPAMIKYYVNWLEQICKVPKAAIRLSLYIHESKSKEIGAVEKFWAGHLGYPARAITAVYLKKNRLSTRRKNTGALYYGTLRVTVSMSSALNRKVAGWIEGVVGSVE